MDIEGSEYDVLPAILADADRITGLVIEFHEVGSRWAHFRTVLEALSGPFAVVHVHGNNWGPLVPGTTVPDVLEVRLLHRRLMTAEELNSVAADPLPYRLATYCPPGVAERRRPMTTVTIESVSRLLPLGRIGRMAHPPPLPDLPQDATPMTADEFAIALTHAISLPGVQLSPDTRFHEVDGWDSLCVLLTIGFADEQFGRTVSGRDIADARTVSDLWTLMAASHG
jgi:acyl carrier protein